MHLQIFDFEQTHGPPRVWCKSRAPCKTARFGFDPAIRGRKSDNDQNSQRATNEFRETQIFALAANAGIAGEKFKRVVSRFQNNRAANGLS